VNGRDVEIPPNWLLVVKSKNKKPRIIPMNSMVRDALSGVIQDAQAVKLFSRQRAQALTRKLFAAALPALVRKLKSRAGKLRRAGSHGMT
jgi:site-specific recombinase XerD